MYNLISIILLIAALNSIQYGTEWFKILLMGAVGFGIAGAIGSLDSKIDNLTIRKKDMIDGSIEYSLKRTQTQIDNNK